LVRGALETDARPAQRHGQASHVRQGRADLSGRDQPDGIFGLVSGSLNISFPRGEDDDYTIHRAGAGFWIGDLALISGKHGLVSVRVAEPTVMVHFAAKDLHERS
jgi:CRP/FNR family transcriptional regulator, cyclic AMP receptor protein